MKFKIKYKRVYSAGYFTYSGRFCSKKAAQKHLKNLKLPLEISQRVSIDYDKTRT